MASWNTITEKLKEAHILPSNNSNITRVIGSVPAYNYGYKTRREVPQNNYGTSHSVASYRNYDTMRNQAMLGDVSAIKGLTNLALNMN